MSISHSDTSTLSTHDSLLFHIIDVPRPSHIIVFSPHPDDLSISMGGFVILAARAGIPINSILLTNGSEAIIPDGFLHQHGWHPRMSVTEVCRLRGEIRLREAQEEAIRLGLKRDSVILLKKQNWFDSHRTPLEAMNADGSIKDVSHFKPGPLDLDSLDEICLLFEKFNGIKVFCAIPCLNDKQLMHRLTTILVLRALSSLPQHRLKNYNLLIYKCLSTYKWEPDAYHRVVGFDENIMKRKCHAIMANESMKSRREVIGGYANRGREFYDTIIRKENAETARHFKLRNSFAECFKWCNFPNSHLWKNMIQWANAQYNKYLE